jgi:hypothetical protein
MLKPSGCDGGGVLPERAICQVVLLQPSIDFHASDAAIVSSRLPSPRIAVARKLRIKQQIPNSRYTRGGLHGSFDNSNCPAAQHYLGLQGTYRPEGDAAHSLTPTTTLFPRMEPATVEAAGCSATLSLSPPPKLPNPIRPAVDGRRRVQCSIGCPRP